MSRKIGPNLIFAVAALALALAGVPASAQPPPVGVKPPAKSSRSLDQQLLDGLDRELLQGLPGGKRPSESAPSHSVKENAPPRSAAKEGESDGTPIESQNPLAIIAQRMRTIENRIAQHDTSAATQAEQGQILHDLDALLEEAKKARQGGKKQGGQRGGSAQTGTGTGNAAAGPPRDSTNRIDRGTQEQAEPADVKDVIRRIWGHLPQKVRDEMQAPLSEQFLPKYERVIEEYYKRLAEERPGGP